MQERDHQPDKGHAAEGLPAEALTAAVLRELVEEEYLPADIALRPLRGSRGRIVLSVLLRFVALLAGTLGIVVALLFVAALFVGREQVRSMETVYPALALTVGSLVAYLLVARFLEGRKFLVELAPRRPSALLIGVAGGGVAFLLCYGLIGLFGGYQVSYVGMNWSAFGMSVLYVGLSAGVLEEILFRGGLFRLSEDIFGTWGAILISAAAFGLGHAFNPNSSAWSTFAIIVEVGVLFGGLYALTRSLWLVIGFHSTWNVSLAVFGIAVSGNEPARILFSTRAIGSAWLTGGEFGMEASIVTVTLLGLLGLVVVLLILARDQTLSPLWRRGPQLTQTGPDELAV
ncbi:CPBP family intramembrane glutamic endopeptidase [Tessaracoccus sp. OH4464_COT-324]|uniref:CPBP family intramembrane glutamic endopeptidase n=1 Tax=Tessaracoccus sp. OH4464_COT-324 TaxID=2491059 RepID=UPI000F63FD7D|nr:type II CAAX endopeptidase family protein [Tessaracoccus sp. OH4464_COT-324]RRD46576.1 CPBP family intramembrane metalloprotease [Tessaracoccus sp. OH4464_COT-324]